jgi:putative flippase GtrA
MIRRLIVHPETFAISKFAIVGAVGFAVDAGLLALGVYVFGAPPIPTRSFSVFVSVIVTWALNRIWTFDARRQESAWIELGRYLGSRAVGAACNVGIFAAAVKWFPYPLNEPIVATPLSSAATMLINYAMVRFFIYDPKKIGSHGDD